jgi:23S rRNA (guanosine2251-2'-O)-methyltransferase
MYETVIGRNPVLEALKARRPIVKLLLEEGARSDPRIAEIVRLAQLGGIAVERVPARLVDRAAAGEVHQGVIAYATPRPRLALDDLEVLSREKNEPSLYVVLDGIEDPHNLGAIVRTAEATGVHGVVTRSQRAVGLTPAALKAAAGAAEYMPVVDVVNIAQAIEALRKKGVWTIGIDTEGGEEYTRIDYRPPTAVVIGAEGKGISDLVRKKCDFLARIPMRGRISSLNASVAAGVVLYEALRQRMGFSGMGQGSARS